MPESRYSRVAYTERYTRRRLALIALMGGRCRICGADEPMRMEFHHTGTRTWTARKLDRCSRLRRYRRDFEKGVLVLLCAACHGRTKNVSQRHVLR